MNARNAQKRNAESQHTHTHRRNRARQSRRRSTAKSSRRDDEIERACGVPSRTRARARTHARNREREIAWRAYDCPAPSVLPSGAERDSEYHSKVMPPGPPCATVASFDSTCACLSPRFSIPPTLDTWPRYRTRSEQPEAVYLANAELARIPPRSADDPLSSAIQIFPRQLFEISHPRRARSNALSSLSCSQSDLYIFYLK